MPGSFTARMLDAEGNPENRAGAHPDRLAVNFGLNPEGTSARDFAFELPPGFGGARAPFRSARGAVFEAGEEECPPQSQVGTSAHASKGRKSNCPSSSSSPRPGQIARFRFESGF